MRARGYRQRVLDIGCGAGISSEGYDLYFDVTGMDNNPEAGRYYPYEFVCKDALKRDPETGKFVSGLDPDYLREFDLIHLGGPCQPWSKMMNCRPGLREKYTDLIIPLRPALQASGVPYVIENVEGAPLIDPVWLCAVAFGYPELLRHRGFETGNGFVLPPMRHPEHPLKASKAGHWVPGTAMSIAGHIAPISKARELMAMTHRHVPREMLAEAAPPYMTAYVAAHATAYLSREAALWTRQATAGSCSARSSPARRSRRSISRSPSCRSRSATSPTRTS